ncbi:enoyl-CoA hydratase/isomerase family protein [Pelagibacterium xiamenense]|uniref:enoyl-CoA hydratase/isomerase family protein n=1 Tax=Pelagibacterium xiamenense TaxID=2901140 RepID=UPI001E58CF2E|nr:enoyl-CoA hydratase/isomerase family protein [Pelagibacterium xiamenense]MCD7061355.1 enoyl-CoA hydratase/isomerase family protein [Pelagibacterium xiamenense]
MSETDEVLISVSGAAGIITLNRPKAINALNASMIEAILAALAAWAHDSTIRLVLIEGAGEKGLCAGGDVRAVREAVLAGQSEAALGFFAREYEMNRMIARFEKPIVALQTGVVMGGGIGVSAHGRFRIATASSKFAMPEGAIGLFPDVGVNAVLAEAPEPRAMAFLLSGVTVGAADAIALGLADAMVDQERLSGIRDRIIDAARAGEPDTQIVAIIQAETLEAGPAQFCATADALAEAFTGDTVPQIISALHHCADEGVEGALPLVTKMEGHAPTSLAVALMAHRRTRRDPSIEAVLKRDLALARWMAVRPDFAEGVRALLIDKDRTPAWTPADHAAVDLTEIAALLD